MGWDYVRIPRERTTCIFLPGTYCQVFCWLFLLINSIQKGCSKSRIGRPRKNKSLIKSRWRKRDQKINILQQWSIHPDFVVCWVPVLIIHDTFNFNPVPLGGPTLIPTQDGMWESQDGRGGWTLQVLDEKLLSQRKKMMVFFPRHSWSTIHQPAKKWEKKNRKRSIPNLGFLCCSWCFYFPTIGFLTVFSECVWKFCPVVCPRKSTINSHGSKVKTLNSWLQGSLKSLNYLYLGEHNNVRIYGILEELPP